MILFMHGPIAVEQSESGNMKVRYVISVIGDEVFTWSGGQFRMWQYDDCYIEVLGTENETVIRQKITDAAVNCVLERLAVTITKTDVFIPQVVKGL